MAISFLVHSCFPNLPNILLVLWRHSDKRKENNKGHKWKMQLEKEGGFFCTKKASDGAPLTFLVALNII
jgi:hypothetical protein